MTDRPSAPDSTNAGVADATRPSVPDATKSGVPDATKAQLLSTEHWSLLATRNLTWSESFSRATWFVTVVSATVVALALVAEGTDFGRSFRLFALVLIPLLIVIGLATVLRLVQLNGEDVHLVMAMNRLRRGYLDLAPELEPYFVTGHSEDFAGIMRTYGGRHSRIPAAQYVSSIALLISVIVALLFGALVGLIAAWLGVGTVGSVVIGIAAGLASLAALALAIVRYVDHTWRDHKGVS
jgi:hypothetical protein